MDNEKAMPKKSKEEIKNEAKKKELDDAVDSVQALYSKENEKEE